MNPATRCPPKSRPNDGRESGASTDRGIVSCAENGAGAAWIAGDVFAGCGPIARSGPSAASGHPLGDDFGFSDRPSAAGPRSAYGGRGSGTSTVPGDASPLPSDATTLSPSQRLI